MSVLRAPGIAALALLLLLVSGGSGSARSTGLLQLLTGGRREAAGHHAHSTGHPGPAALPIKTDYSSVEARERNQVNKSIPQEQILGKVGCFPEYTRDLALWDTLVELCISHRLLLNPGFYVIYFD